MLRFILWLNRLWHEYNDARLAQWVKPRAEWKYDRNADNQDPWAN